jgi:DNA polymerase-3 subunit epsilon
MFERRVCFLDLETTGMSPERERITEIGVVMVEDGQVIEEWTTLVNPGKPIPPEIAWFTGISNDMVRDAPRFEAVADALWQRLEGSLLVAHNARFDYGFVKAEYARLGRVYITKPLCTVKLSRTLDPDQRSHSLDALIARWRLSSEARHRALGDARRLWELAGKWQAAHPPETIAAAVKQVLKRAALPPLLPPTLLDDMPTAPGIYCFRAAGASGDGRDGQLLYIGKSIHLRERVAAHFYDVKSEREQQLAAQVARVEWTETAGPLSAAVLEAQRIKADMPAQNVTLRRKEKAVLMRLNKAGKLQWLPATAVPTLPDPSQWWGPFGSRPGARAVLTSLAREFSLCLKTLGMERGAPGAACFNHQIRRCMGVCVGQESEPEHRMRIEQAMLHMRLPSWSDALGQPGAIAFVERNPERFTEDWVVADGWCLLGVVKTRHAAQELAASAPRQFDPDLYRMLAKALQDSDAIERLALHALDPQINVLPFMP